MTDFTLHPTGRRPLHYTQNLDGGERSQRSYDFILKASVFLQVQGRDLAGRAFSSIGQNFTTWNERVDRQSRLSRLNAHMLRDIGMTLSDRNAAASMPLTRA